MMRYFFPILILLLAAVALAGFGGEQVVTADGGVRMTGGHGPETVEFLANGDATVKLIKGATTADAETYFMANGDSLFNLRENIPRIISVAGTTVDSVYFDVDTATEVIVTW